MLKTFVLLFCLSITLGVGYSASNGTTTATPAARNTSTTAKPTTTTKPTTGNSTAKPSNKSTSTKPTTTAKPTTGNTTTKPSNKSTSTNPTTTAKPTTSTSTTTKPTNGSSTVKPTNGTSSTLPSTTTKAPTTAPPYGIFSLKKKGKNDTEYCLLAEFEATFKINYMANVSKDKGSQIMEKSLYLNRSNYQDVIISGNCDEAQLVLTWPRKKHFYKLAMVFSKVAKKLEAKSNSSKWRLGMITLDVILEGNEDFKGATEKNFTSSFDGSSSPTYDVGGYYSCNSRDDTKKFKTDVKNYTVQPVFEDVKLEPFVSKNSTEAFGKNEYQCYQDHPTHASTTKGPGNNDIVPIAVGCALAGLVLIVLIAYIIGRRKSHRGYEKV